jgi:hypothetical protein
MKLIEVQPDLKVEELIRLARNEDVIVTQDGHAVALLSGYSDDDLDWYAREREAEFLASLARAREQVATGQAAKHEDLKRQLGIE